MKRIIFLFFLVFLFSCGSEKPKNLLSKDEMAEIIADLAIYNQSYIVDDKINLDETDRFVLQKHNITTKDFQENYEFYTFTPSSLDEIFDKAKKIIRKKDPNLKFEN